MAIVELAEGYKMLTGLVDVAPEDVQYDMPVVVTYEDLDEEFSLPKFRPAVAGGQNGAAAEAEAGGGNSTLGGGA